MNLTKITALLSERSARDLTGVVAEIESAIAAGTVPNTLFSDAKYTFNRAAEQAAEAYLATGPHAEKHTQSDWWLAAYKADAFVHGAHNIPSAIKRAEKAGIAEYNAFLTELLPLHALLQQAKPLIKKRCELPRVKRVQL